MESIAAEAALEFVDSTANLLTRYLLFAFGVWFVLWVLLRGALRGRKIREQSPPARQLVVEFFTSIRSMLIFSAMSVLMMFMGRAGWLAGEWSWSSNLGIAWPLACLIAMVLVHDAYFYWAHRAMHHPKLFRAFHRRHHLSNNPSPFTAYSFNITEAMVMVAFVPLWSMVVPTPPAVIALFMLHQIVRNTLGHSGYELMPAKADGRPMVDWLTTTTHHDLHHAEAGYNYGFYFTWWDRWMKTEHPDYNERFAAAVRKPLLTVRRARLPAATLCVLAATLCVLVVLLAVPRAHAQSPTIRGDWATQGLAGVVRIEACSGASQRVCGRLIWSWARGVERGDIVILRNFSQNGAVMAGEIFDPEDGRTYRATLRVAGDTMSVRGCVGPFCRAQTWRRLESIPRPD